MNNILDKGTFETKQSNENTQGDIKVNVLTTDPHIHPLFGFSKNKFDNFVDTNQPQDGTSHSENGLLKDHAVKSTTSDKSKPTSLLYSLDSNTEVYKNKSGSIGYESNENPINLSDSKISTMGHVQQVNIDESIDVENQGYDLCEDGIISNTTDKIIEKGSVHDISQVHDHSNAAMDENAAQDNKACLAIVDGDENEVGKDGCEDTDEDIDGDCDEDTDGDSEDGDSDEGGAYEHASDDLCGSSTFIDRFTDRFTDRLTDRLIDSLTDRFEFRLKMTSVQLMSVSILFGFVCVFMTSKQLNCQCL